MGSSYTRPALNRPDVPFLMISFYHDKLRIFNADEHVLSLIRNTLQSHYPKGCNREEMKDDVVIFKLNGYPFDVDFSSHHKSFLIFACVLMTQLSQKGFIKIFSSDMNWYNDRSVWFFYKAPTTVANNMEFCAIDLWSWDKIKIFNAPSTISETIKFCVHENWKGIQKAEFEEENCFALKLKGIPWESPGGEDGVKNRLLIMKIIHAMGTYGWTLYSATNIDGKTDTMFFCRKAGLFISPEFANSMIAVSLNRNDRLRLMNADGGIIELVRSVIQREWPLIQEEGDHYGSYQFKLKGNPWHCTGKDAIPSVHLLCQVFRELRKAGWKIIMNLDISKSDSDKGVFFLVRMPPKETSFFSIALKGEDRIFAVDVPEKINQQITQVISTLFTVQEQVTVPPPRAATTWKLEGTPWSSTGGSVHFNGQMLIAAIVSKMTECNYHVTSAADISSVIVDKDNEPKYKPDGDAYFFAFDDYPFNVGLFTDQPAFTPVGFFTSTAPPPPPSYEVLYGAE